MMPLVLPFLVIVFVVVQCTIRSTLEDDMDIERDRRALSVRANMIALCPIFGPTSEPTHHGRNVISGDLSKPNVHGTNPMLTLYTDKQPSEMRHYNINTRGKRETNMDPCEPFTYKPAMKRLTHPKDLRDPMDLGKLGEDMYARNVTCFTTIYAEKNQVITLTFIDVFHIEGHPQCENDYLEIRDGRFGYATPVYKFCGKSFPPTITSSGPFLWLKFKSDDTIEYSGFVIDIDISAKATSKEIHESCYKTVSHQTSGLIDSNSKDLEQCREHTVGPLDIQWKIETAHGTQIYLNVTKFQLKEPNNCSANSVQLFGAEPNFDHGLRVYCSSVAESLVTAPETEKSGPGNIMYVRMFTEHRGSNFSAVFTEFRTAASCHEKTEFNCLDGTCIDISLRCDREYANCRLKTDEDPGECRGEAQSLMKDNSTILIVFSLILSGIVFVLLFKCARKVYKDQKQINAHRAANLTSLLSVCKSSQLTLNTKPTRDFDPLSLEYPANQMRRQNIQQKSSSIDSDLLQPLDPNEDWPESIPILPEHVRIEHQGRDFSHKEETLRAKSKEESENRDASADAPGLHEAECQTRESLFLMDPITKPGSNRIKSRSNSRVSGAVSPAPALAELGVGILRQSTAQDTGNSQTERPMSSETTRSAPDVIIVSPSQLVESRR